MHQLIIIVSIAILKIFYTSPLLVAIKYIRTTPKLLPVLLAINTTTTHPAPVVALDTKNATPASIPGASTSNFHSPDLSSSKWSQLTTCKPSNNDDNTDKNTGKGLPTCQANPIPGAQCAVM